MKGMQKIQPELTALKEKYKDNKEKMGPEIMALYKERKINPFGSCLPLLVQLPFLIAIYRVFFDELKDGATLNTQALYPFVANPGSLDPIAFGFFNFADKSLVLAILAGLAQFWQSKMMIGKAKSNNPAAAISNQMMYMMPVITVLIGASFPAGLTFYWLLTTLFSVAQQYIVLGMKQNKIEIVETQK